MAEQTATTLEQQRVPTPEEFNKVILAAKQGGENRIVPVDDTDKETVETIFVRTIVINGQPLKFQGETPESVLDQVTAAIQAAGTIKPKEPEIIAPEKKQPITEKDMFDIGVKLQKGDASAINEYLDKSDYVGKKLAEQGINVAELKQATKVALDSQTAQSWESATAEFLKMPENDWPGGDQNQELLGMMIARMKLTPSAANIKLAYDELKSKNMLFSVDGKEAATKRKASSSTAFGIGGRPTDQQRNGTGPTISKSAFENAKSQQERDAIFNRYRSQGGNIEKPNWVA